MKINQKLGLIVLLLLLATSITFGIAYYLQLKKKHSVALIEQEEYKLALKADLNQLLEVTQFKDQLLSADNHFILGDYEAALEAYRLLQDHDTLEDSSLIQLRIQRIEEIKSNKDTLFHDYRSLQYALTSISQKRDSLLTEMDSLSNGFKSTLSAVETEKRALQDSLKIKNKKLQRKDKIQVITFKNEQGNTVHYLGEISNNMANGGGVGIWDTGGIYKGEWKNNLRHGKGSYTWKDGHRYEGEFVNGIREGEGTYYWSSGEKYEGQWENGKRNGEGTLYDKDNNISYQGQWVNDKVAEK